MERRGIIGINLVTAAYHFIGTCRGSEVIFTKNYEERKETLLFSLIRSSQLSHSVTLRADDGVRLIDVNA